MLHFSCVKPGHREQAVRSLSGLVAPTTQFNSSFQSTAMPRGAAQKRSTHSEGLESRWGRLLFALSLFLVLFICSVAFEKMTLCVKSLSLVSCRRTAAPAVHKSRKKQSDHLHLSGSTHAHLPLTTHCTSATEEPAGTSGELDWLVDASSKNKKIIGWLFKAIFQCKVKANWL